MVFSDQSYPAESQPYSQLLAVPLRVSIGV